MTGETWREISRFADHAQRGELLLEHEFWLSDADYWTAVGAAWLDSERQTLTRADWRRLWGSERPGRREHVMTPDERDHLDSLDERVTVFRGANAMAPVSGISWTLDREQADWFALRFVTPEWPGIVISGTARRERVLALIHQRQKSEIVVFPRYVYRREWSAPTASGTSLRS